MLEACENVELGVVCPSGSEGLTTDWLPDPHGFIDTRIILGNHMYNPRSHVGLKPNCGESVGKHQTRFYDVDVGETGCSE